MFGERYTCRGARPFVSVIALDERNVYLQELNSPIRPELSYLLSLYELYSMRLQNGYVCDVRGISWCIQRHACYL